MYSFVFYGWPQTLHVNPGCLKSSQAWTFIMPISMLFIFIHLKQISPNNGILLERVLIPNWLNNPLASCCFWYCTLHTSTKALFSYSWSLQLLGHYYMYSFCISSNMITSYYSLMDFILRFWVLDFIYHSANVFH